MRIFAEGETIIYVGGGKVWNDNYTPPSLGEEVVVIRSDSSFGMNPSDSAHLSLITFRNGFEWHYTDNFVYPWELEPED